MRELAYHPSKGGGRGGVRRAERGPGRRGEAAVQLLPGIAPGPEITEELLAFCTQHLARQKCPRSIDFEDELPRLPTGKLYKRLLRDRYWQGHKTRIV